LPLESEVGDKGSVVGVTGDVGDVGDVAVVLDGVAEVLDSAGGVELAPPL